MDARRLRLYDLLKPKLGERPAQELVLALPAQPENLVTRDDLHEAIGGLESSLESKLAVQFAEINARFAEMEATLTRRMIAIMGAWTVSVASAFAWASVVFG